MKKVLSILLILASLCALISCSYFESEPTIEVNEDGYVVVNGVVTEHKITPDITEIEMLMELIEQFQNLSPEENPLKRLTVIK